MSVHGRAISRQRRAGVRFAFRRHTFSKTLGERMGGSGVTICLGRRFPSAIELRQGAAHVTLIPDALAPSIPFHIKGPPPPARHPGPIPSSTTPAGPILMGRPARPLVPAACLHPAGAWLSPGGGVESPSEHRGAPLPYRKPRVAQPRRCATLGWQTDCVSPT
ncbi:hypothetical protein AAFF_G00057750 [Aldrovandia affinis]|uniref:Uncharacterized protein n=1 Tax=Aldrovandia affinis TaxID=143900 RepID=A0AAD7S0J0_9TELE|nr:hypothetical protein AAFF_G00057750 [Aldrovandia affinis]